MRLGVISDTHGMLRPTVANAFHEVDRIVHCGDIGSVQILEKLRSIAPVTAAYGNTDGLDVRLCCSKVVRFEYRGRTIVALHGDQFGMPTPGTLRTEFPDVDIILFGHTHKPIVEQSHGEVIVMNPGAAGAVRCGCKPSVGVIELDNDSPPSAWIIPLNTAR